MSTPARKVGLLGGTFDPVHQGHLHMARAAQSACRLERIYFAPAASPWHKAAPAADYQDRYAMVALSLLGHPSWLPLHIPAPPARSTYAIDQLAWMREHHRGEQVHFILGADAFLTLPTWKQYRRLLTGCDFVVLARDGIKLADLVAIVPPKLVASVQSTGVGIVGGRRLHWLSNFSCAASSTSARSWLAASSSGKGTDRTVPAAVAQYARRADLYRYGKHL